MSKLHIKNKPYCLQVISDENKVEPGDIVVLKKDLISFKADTHYKVVKHTATNSLMIECKDNGSTMWIAPNRTDDNYDVYRRERSIPVPTRFERVMIAKYVQDGITVTSRKLAIDSVVFFESDKDAIITRIKDSNPEYAECELSLRTANYSTYQATKRPGFYDVHVDFDIDASYIVDKFKLKEFGQ